MKPLKENVECDHNWEVVILVKTVAWDEFIQYRTNQQPATEQNLMVTHTLFCDNCNRFKQVI